MIQNKAGIIGRQDSVLVVIDVQEKLVPHIYRHEQLVQQCRTLIQVAQRLEVPVVWAEQEKLGPTVSPLTAGLTTETPIQKTAFSCFGCAEFREKIAELGRKTLILCGMETHVCVTQTALGALPNFTVHVVADAVSSRTAENREVGLARMRQAGCVVSSVEMVSFEWLQRAGTDDFRSILPLMK